MKEEIVTWTEDIFAVKNNKETKYLSINKLITNNHQIFKENPPKHDIQQKSFKGITKRTNKPQSQQKKGNSKDQNRNKIEGKRNKNSRKDQ